MPGGLRAFLSSGGDIFTNSQSSQRTENRQGGMRIKEVEGGVVEGNVEGVWLGKIKRVSFAFQR